MKTAHDLVAAAKAQVHEVPIDQADEAIRLADVLIDVREADEYQAGHIPGAIHASRGVLEFKLSSTPALTSRDLKVVVYCKTSGRAALAACAMRDMGTCRCSPSQAALTPGLRRANPWRLPSHRLSTDSVVHQPCATSCARKVPPPGAHA